MEEEEKEIEERKKNKKEGEIERKEVTTDLHVTHTTQDLDSFICTEPGTLLRGNRHGRASLSTKLLEDHTLRTLNARCRN